MANLKEFMVGVTAQSVRDNKVTHDQAITAEFARWLDAIADACRRNLPYARLDISYVDRSVRQACAEECVSRGFQFSEHGNDFNCHVYLEWR